MTMKIASLIKQLKGLAPYSYESADQYFCALCDLCEMTRLANLEMAGLRHPEPGVVQSLVAQIKVCLQEFKIRYKDFSENLSSDQQGLANDFFGSINERIAEILETQTLALAGS